MKKDSQDQSAVLYFGSQLTLYFGGTRFMPSGERDAMQSIYICIYIYIYIYILLFCIYQLLLVQ